VLLQQEQLHEVDGVPVQDSFGATLCYAEMLVRLRRTSGMAFSRARDMGRPDPASLERFERAAAEALTA
jgi:hypothetical protein